MTKILMVCLGNICRSPLAEGILKFKVDTTKIQVDSAGTGNFHIGEMPCENAIKVAKENLLDITDQRARQFKVSDFTTFDLIFSMDKHNYKKLIVLAPDDKAKAKVKLILNEVFPDEDMDVPDPYNSSFFAFRNVYRMLDEACDSIARKIKADE